MKSILILILLLCSCGVHMRKMNPVIQQNIDFKNKNVLIYRSNPSAQYINMEEIENFKEILDDTNLFGYIAIDRNLLEYDYYIDLHFMHQQNVCDKYCLFLSDVRALPSIIFPFWYDEYAGYHFTIYNKDRINIADINTIGKSTYIDWGLGFILRIIPDYANNESRYIKNELLINMQK